MSDRPIGLTLKRLGSIKKSVKGKLEDVLAKKLAKRLVDKINMHFLKSK